MIIPQTKDYLSCALVSVPKVDLETNFVYRFSTARMLVSAIEEVRAWKDVSEWMGPRWARKIWKMLDKYEAEKL